MHDQPHSSHHAHHSQHAHHIPTARDIMTSSVVTVSPDLCIFDAIGVLLKNGISGTPVVDAAGDLVGMLSELDCLRVLASDEFYLDDHAGSGTVREFMSRDGQTIGPEADLYSIAHYFLTRSVRRFPVVHKGHLLGQVSRHDVLRGIESMRKKRAPKKHYPDYREPA
jgi:CBS domain-containing protein